MATQRPRALAGPRPALLGVLLSSIGRWPVLVAQAYMYMLRVLRTTISEREGNSCCRPYYMYVRPVRHKAVLSDIHVVVDL
eukprot:COSAG01_NODE_120_length_25409_cov_20.648572_15_plen_81_part_00